MNAIKERQEELDFLSRVNGILNDPHKDYMAGRDLQKLLALLTEDLLERKQDQIFESIK